MSPTADKGHFYYSFLQSRRKVPDATMELMFDEEYAHNYTRMFEGFAPSNWMGVQQIVIRYGKIQGPRFSAIELLTFHERTENGKKLGFDWAVFMTSERAWIDFSHSSKSPIREETWSHVLNSIELKNVPTCHGITH